MEEDALNPREYLEGLLRWWWVLLVVPLMLAGIIAAVGANEPAPPPQYRATATVLMQSRSGVNNFPQLVTTRPFLDAAVKRSGLSVSLDELQAIVSARLVADTDFLEIRATHTQPAQAAGIANAVAAEFVRHVQEIRESQLTAGRAELVRRLEPLGEFAEVLRVVEAVETSLETLVPSLAGVALVVPVEASLTGGSAELVRQSEAVSELANVLRVFETVDASLESLMPSLAGVALVVAAEPPQSPLPQPKNHMIRNVTLGLVVGLMLSIGLVMLLDYLRNPAGSAPLFQRRFGISHLGTVPRWSKGTGKSRNLLVDSDPEPGSAEAIKQAAANIEFGARASGINSIVVASPDIGEGRSSLIANLAVAISSSWKKVVVVDADLRLPSLHSYFGLNNDVGLASLLADPGLDVSSVLQETSHDGLWVLTSGPLPADPVGLLNSPRMAGLIKRLENEAGLVLVDTPPMAALADGAVVASQVGAAVMVVNPSSSRTGDVKLVLGNLEQANARVLDFIWNRVAHSSITHYARYEKHCRRRAANGMTGQLAPRSNG